MIAITREEIFSDFVEHIHISVVDFTRSKKQQQTSNTVVYKMLQAQDRYGICVSASEACYELASSILYCMKEIFQIVKKIRKELIDLQSLWFSACDF